MSFLRDIREIERNETWSSTAVEPRMKMSIFLFFHFRIFFILKIMGKPGDIFKTIILIIRNDK